jgi:hypothetical protein
MSQDHVVVSGQKFLFFIERYAAKIMLKLCRNFSGHNGDVLGKLRRLLPYDPGTVTRFAYLVFNALQRIKGGDPPTAACTRTHDSARGLLRRNLIELSTAKAHAGSILGFIANFCILGSMVFKRLEQSVFHVSLLFEGF